jgi:hydroxyacylglutathione hydrolase
MDAAPVTVTADAEQFTCNAYLIPGASPALVDAGTMPGVERVIADHVDDLRTVVVTHQHADHVGELDAVLDALDPTPDVLAYGDHPRRTRGLDDGDEVTLGGEPFEVVYTPGHAGDHVALLGETALFSGDVVVYNDGAYDDGSFGRTDMPGQSRERLIASLRTLLERLPESVETIYPGHGDVYRAGDNEADDTVRDVVERALARAERREPKYPDE